MSKGTRGMLIITALCIIGFFATCGYERINSGCVGIQVELFGTNKGVQDVVAVTGGNFYNRWTQEIYEFPTSLQHKVWSKDTISETPHNEEIQVTTSDGMSISFDIGFDYMVIPDQVPTIFVKYRLDLDQITSQYLSTAVRTSYSEAASVYDSDTLMFRRNTYERAVRQILERKIGAEFQIVQLGIIGQLRFSPDLQTAIDNKIKVTQEAQTVENGKRTAIASAINKIETAKGDSTATVIAAQAAAQSILIKAHAEAEANEKLSKSITPMIIQREWINAWNGVMPQYTTTSAPMIGFGLNK